MVSADSPRWGVLTRGVWSCSTGQPRHLCLMHLSWGTSVGAESVSVRAGAKGQQGGDVIALLEGVIAC